MFVCFADSGTANMERVPRVRQDSALTRGSVSESSQRTTCPDDRHAPENPELGSRRTPASGVIFPAKARQIIASPSASAMATPSAPVIARARAATNCKTSSRTKCSNRQRAAGLETTSSLSCTRRWRICWCSAEKAKRACRASPLEVAGGAERKEAGVSVNSFPPSSNAVFGLALIAAIPVRKTNANHGRIKNKDNLSADRNRQVTKGSRAVPCYFDTTSICNVQTVECNRNISAGHEGRQTVPALS